MKLTLDRVDLRKEHADISCGLTRIEHFKSEVQAAIRAVGRATFVEFDGRTYNAIYPGEEVDSRETPDECRGAV